MALIFDVRHSCGHLSREATDVVTEIRLIVNSSYSLSKTVGLVAMPSILQGTYIQPIAEKKLLIERC